MAKPSAPGSATPVAASSQMLTVSALPSAAAAAGRWAKEPVSRVAKGSLAKRRRTAAPPMRTRRSLNPPVFSTAASKAVRIAGRSATAPLPAPRRAGFTATRLGSARRTVRPAAIIDIVNRIQREQVLHVLVFLDHWRDKGRPFTGRIHGQFHGGAFHW